MEAIHKLRVECPYGILKVEDINIECKPNEHGYLSMKCLIDDTFNFNYSIKASTDDKICIYEEIENGEKSIIFNGLIQNIRTTNVNGIYYLKLDGISSSFKLDIEEKSRSFQDIEMTYYDVIEEVLKDYKGFGYSQRMDKPQKIGRPIFQYKETDFNFLKRLASQLGIDLVCDIIKFNNMFYFGRPQEEKYILEDEISYRVYKNLEKYYKAKPERGIDFHDTDFFYYEVDKREKMNIGDKIEFKQKKLYINQFTAKFHHEELIYTYRLCREDGIWQEKIDNEKLKGVSLEGKVLEVKDELVKLHLGIDKEQNQAKAFWFTFAPPTGNIMYSMPIVGTNAMLYFPNVSKVNPIVIGCVRKNGGTYEKFSDVNNRYYTTEHKNQLAMIPDSISFTCSGNPGLNVTFDDAEGVILKSDKDISVTAKNEFIIKTETKVRIEAQTKLEVQRENEQAGISLENDMYCFGDIVHENGSCMETYGPCDQAPALEILDIMNGKNIASAMEGANVASAQSNIYSKDEEIAPVSKEAVPFVSNELIPNIDKYDPYMKDYYDGMYVQSHGRDNKYYLGTVKTNERKGIVEFQPLEKDAFEKAKASSPVATHEEAREMYPQHIKPDDDIEIKGSDDGITEKQRQALNSENMKEIKEKYPGEYGRIVQGAVDGNREYKAAPKQLSLLEFASPQVNAVVAIGEGVTGYNWVSGEKLTTRERIQGILFLGIGKLQGKIKELGIISGEAKVGTKAEQFDIVKYGDKTPGLENHHGVMDMWAQKNIPGYKPRPAASTAIALTTEQHNATRVVYGKWKYENYGFKGKVDWENISPREIQELSEKMFDAAKVPQGARAEYYREFNKYIYGLEN